MKRKCQIGPACNETVRKLLPCAVGDKARPASEIIAAASSLAGQTVRVRGPLGVGELSGFGSGALILCGDVPCCGRVSAPVVLGADNGTLELVGLHCTGDVSRACCNAPAYGQAVVASGRLTRHRDASGPSTAGWQLVDVSVCEEAARPGESPR